MAHELDFKADGAAAMFAVGTTPWHRLGTVLTGAPSFDDALKIAGIDYTVALREVRYIPDGAAESIASGTGYVVVRTDREGTPAGALAQVGERYEPVQNVDAFRTLLPLIDAGVATIETAGALRGGRDAWMLVKFTIDDGLVQEVFGEKILPYGLVTSNHSGARRVLLKETPVVVVCANTLTAALNSGVAVSVRHSGDASVRLVEAAQDAFSKLVNRYHNVAEKYKAMQETRLTVDAFIRSVCEPIAPLPEASDKGSERGFKIAQERAETKRKELFRLWHEGLGVSGDGTAWDGFMAATQLLDHDTELSPCRGNRLESMMQGPIARRKEDCFAAVLAECKK